MKPNIFKRKALVLAIAATALPISGLQAQVAEPALMEEVVVVGSIRDSIRNGIEIKRQASTIVDAISASDIGELPDLSVAETLERLPGVTGDRFKGNASEISIRGLGPFLVSSTFNGREISSGSGNRTVAFSQFPSELVNKAIVYKAQQADIVEGGVAGSIDLGAIRPIDYGKRRIQGEFRANYNEYQGKLEGQGGVGYRGSLSYTDVFETDSAGTIGFAIGVASTDGSTPEESFNTSGTLRPCNSDSSLGDVLERNNNCSYRPDNARGNADPALNDFYYIANNQFYRQMESEETRDAIMTTLQWQPNENWDIALDYMFSNRFYFEDRHDLTIDDGRRRISDWITNDQGDLIQYSGETRLGSYGEYRERDEDYTAGGLNVAWQATDKLKLTADISTTETERLQNNWQTRFRSERVWYDVSTNPNDYSELTAIYDDQGDRGNSLLPLSETINDLSFYNDDSRARYQELLIEDSINTFSFDGEYDIDGDFFTTFKAGIRVSDRETNFYGQDTSSGISPVAGSLDTVQAQCSQPFPQSGYAEDSASSLSSWATYDTLCAFNAMVGQQDWQVNPTDASPSDVLYQEETTALFAMATFDTEIGSMPLTGNFGVRVIQNNITSTEFSSEYAVEVESVGADGEVEIVEVPAGDAVVVRRDIENDYINVLPSLNLNLAITDEVNLRSAIYRAVSRPDMWWYGAARTLNIDEGGDTGDFESVEDFLASPGNSLNGNGNPFLEAIESDNFDLAIGFYPSEDTSFTVTAYYKEFNAGFGEESGVTEQATLAITGLDGQVSRETRNLPINGRINISDEKSDILGGELSIEHSFSYLPEPWDGLGVSAAYNYADTSFETPERRGEIVSGINAFNELVEAGSADVTDGSSLVAPASLPGFSNETYNLEAYWENYGWSARASYKFRSSYLKPFDNTLNQTNRFVLDRNIVDASVRYKISDVLSIKFQGLNLTNEPYVESRVTEGTNSRVEFNGRRFFVGFQFKL